LTAQQTEITAPIQMISNGLLPITGSSTGSTSITYYTGAEAQLPDPNNASSASSLPPMSITIKNIVNVILRVTVKCDTDFFTINGNTFESTLLLNPEQITTFSILLNKSVLNVRGTGIKSNRLSVEVTSPARDGLIYTSTLVTPLPPNVIKRMPTTVVVG
jgi:hypothetical protein